MTSQLKVTRRVLRQLQCPRTRRRLTESTSEAGSLRPIVRRGAVVAPRLEATEGWLATDQGVAYPIDEGFPGLIWPDVSFPEGVTEEVDLEDRKYCEAYSEMAFYNPVARRHAEELKSGHGWKVVEEILVASPEPKDFPKPHRLWIDATFDTTSELDAYEYLAPLVGKIALQLGGSGRHAIKFLLAGAEEAVLLTPMIGEAVYAWELACAAGVQERFSCVLGVGEEMPFADDSFDVIFSAGCMHHMQLDVALAEVKRVLRPSGRFSAYDPWRAPLYAIGTALLGKREHGLFNRSQSVFCHPFTAERLEPLRSEFPQHAARNHGPLLRYPMLALSKVGLELDAPSMLDLARLDDRVGRLLGLGAAWGGSMMIGGIKAAE